MGQDLSIEHEDVTRFRKMVVHAYNNNVEGLRAHFSQASINFQISRSAYNEILRVRLDFLELISDSRRRQEEEDEVRMEDLQFNSALQSGKLVLGDTLVHIASRNGHDGVLSFLLGCSAREDIPNFRGELPLDVCRSPGVIDQLEALTVIHTMAGKDFPGTARAQQLIKISRRIWLVWMFNTWEGGILLKCVMNLRTSRPEFQKYLKIMTHQTNRYKAAASEQGLAHAYTLMAQYEDDPARATAAFHTQPYLEKLVVAQDVLSHNLADELGACLSPTRTREYVSFIDAAMAGWIRMVRMIKDNGDKPLHKSVVKRLEAEIWNNRLKPSDELVEPTCFTVHSLQDYLEFSVNEEDYLALPR